MDSRWGDAKPIQTRYAGHHFRSRQEARWAVFMDTAGIAWEYEPQGFDLDGLWYLPDFWLPELGYWVEVKPDVEGAEAWREPVVKALRLAKASRRPVVILLGPVVGGREYTTPHVKVTPKGVSLGHQWARCLACGEADVAPDPERVGGPMRCGHTAIGSTPELLAAYEAAASARF